ncbi:unnamed protein product, partial [Nesidiocoris tenuis]
VDGNVMNLVELKKYPTPSSPPLPFSHETSLPSRFLSFPIAGALYDPRFLSDYTVQLYPSVDIYLKKVLGPVLMWATVNRILHGGSNWLTNSAPGVSKKF